jgi:WD40 repeat protein
VGQISPDGVTAALTEYGINGPDGMTLHLLDLSSGQDRPVDGRQAGSTGTPSAMVWSPDGRTLFYLDAAGLLFLVDARTGAVRTLGVALPPMNQLIFRIRPRS